jgi:hypothetical protein
MVSGSQERDEPMIRDLIDDYELDIALDLSSEGLEEPIRTCRRPDRRRDERNFIPSSPGRGQ